MITFNELNKNLNEFNLIKMILNYVEDKDEIFEKYKILLKKYNFNLLDRELYLKEDLSLDFIKYFKKELSLESILKFDMIKGKDKFWFIEKFKNDLDFNFIISHYKSNIKDLIKSNYFDYENRSFDLKIRFLKKYEKYINWHKMTKRIIKCFSNKKKVIKIFQDNLDLEQIITSKIEYNRLRDVLNYQNNFRYELKYYPK